MSAGLFFVVLAVSGSLLGFQDNIDRALHLQLHQVMPAGQVRSLAEMLDSLHKAFPADDPAAITMPVSPRDAWSVALPGGIAFIDPYTARVWGFASAAPPSLE